MAWYNYSAILQNKGSHLKSTTGSAKNTRDIFLAEKDIWVGNNSGQ